MTTGDRKNVARPAIDYLNDNIEKHPYIPDLYLDRATLHYNLDDKRASLKDARTALELFKKQGLLNDENRKQCLARMGACNMILKNYEEGVKQFTIIIEEIDENYGYAYYDRGRCYTGLGKWELALKDEKKALEIFEKSEIEAEKDLIPKVKMVIEKMKRQRVNRKIQAFISKDEENGRRQALDYLKKEIEKNPETPNLYLERANLYYVLDDKRLALKDVETAYGLYKKQGKLNASNKKVCLFRMGECNLNLENYEKAIKQFTIIIEELDKNDIRYNGTVFELVDFFFLDTWMVCFLFHLFF